MGESVAAMAEGRAMGAQAQGNDRAWRQVPLPFLKCGQDASIVKIRGKEDLRRHLESMGFVPGASIKAVSEVSGNVIVEVKGTQVALSRQVATHIVVAL